MGAAIWSASTQDILDYPAESFIQFWFNHGLLQVTGRPQWKTVSGGSKSYVEKILKPLEGRYHIATPVVSVERSPECVTLSFSNRAPLQFDAVVIATHADQAFQLLSDPDDEEIRGLKPWTYSRNRTLLHTDTGAMPPHRHIWASWNYIASQNEGSIEPVTLTYYMNRLQNLLTKQDYFVTLNPGKQLNIDPSKIIKDIIYTHPIFSEKALKTQATLPLLNGKNRSYFCGSYFGYGFHEDAVKSAVSVAQQLGAAW